MRRTGNPYEGLPRTDDEQAQLAQEEVDMKLRTTVLAALAAVTLGTLSACVVEPAGGYYADVAVAPPPPRVVIEPAVRVGYVWAPGYWRWNGHQHVWTDGHYIRERR